MNNIILDTELVKGYSKKVLKQLSAISYQLSEKRQITAISYQLSVVRKKAEE